MVLKVALEVSLLQAATWTDSYQRPAGLWYERAASTPLLEHHADCIQHQRARLLEILALGLNLRQFGRIDPALARVLVDDAESKRAHAMNGTAGTGSNGYRFRSGARLRLVSGFGTHRCRARRWSIEGRLAVDDRECLIEACEITAIGADDRCVVSSCGDDDRCVDGVAGLGRPAQQAGCSGELIREGLHFNVGGAE